MPFIGQQPVTGAYHKLDSITTSATATYNLLLNGGAYSPASANHLLVSLNGVMQAPQDSFTVSGSQITFASALTSSDNIDFIMALGDVLNIGTPSDGTVNTSQLVNSAVTDAKLASTLDLSGKTVTYGLASGDMPAPSIINFQKFETGSYTALTSNVGYTDLANTFSYTPVSSSSTLLIYVYVNCMLIGTGNNPSYTFSKARLKVDGTADDQSIVEAGVRWDTVTGTKETSSSHTLQSVYTNSSTSAKSIVLQALTDVNPTSGFYIRWGERTGRTTCLVLELAR
jgi:hypothetical protein